MKTSSSLAALDAISERVPTNGSACVDIHREIDKIRDGLSALNRLNKTPNPLETPAAHYRRVAKGAGALKDSIERARNRMQSHYAMALEGMGQAIVDKLGLRENAYASELRQAFRSMTSSERLDFLKQAAETGDGATLAAICRVPPALVGVSKEVQKAYIETAEAKHCAELVAMRDAVDEAFLNCGLIAASTAIKAAGELADERQLQAIDAAEAAAVRASGDLEAALG